MIGSIHANGCSILEKNDYDVFEITNFSTDNLIEQLQDIEGIALRTAKLTKKYIREM